MAEALEAFARAEIPEESVLEALRGTRLFAPVLAELSQAHVTEDGLVSDKESEMALVSISAPDGRRALPVFTSVDALTSWHPQARPVAAEARRTALAGFVTAAAPEIGSQHAGPLRDGLKSLQLAFREASFAPDAPGKGPGENLTGPVF